VPLEPQKHSKSTFRAPSFAAWRIVARARARCPAKIAWEAAAGPTERRQGSRCAQPASPACGLDCAPLARLFCFHAFMACSARSPSSCRGSARSQGYSVTWRRHRPFCGSVRLATVAPWLPLTNRSYCVRRTAPHLTISTTTRVRPRVIPSWRLLLADLVTFSHLQFSQIRGRQPFQNLRKTLYVIPSSATGGCLGHGTSMRRGKNYERANSKRSGLTFPKSWRPMTANVSSRNRSQ
jgi:hypothetical protein